MEVRETRKAKRGQKPRICLSLGPATAAPKPTRKSRAGRRARIALEGPKRNGRPLFEPTVEQSDRVRRLKLLGVNDDKIAGFVGVSDDTLRRHFDYELKRGRIDLLANIAAVGYQRALGGDCALIQFFLRTQAGWVERKELTGADGQRLIPAATPPVLLVDFSGMLDDETEAADGVGAPA